MFFSSSFEDRFQHQHCCCHADPIAQGRDAQRPEFAIGFRYKHSSDGVRSVSLLPERKRQFTKPPLHPIRFDVRKLLTIHSRCALVGAASANRFRLSDWLPGTVTPMSKINNLAISRPVATTPAQRLDVLIRSLTQPYQPSPKGSSGRPAHRPFRGLLGVHSRYGLHTRAVTVYRDTLTGGFSHFVTSMTAPVASGWSGCRVGLAPTGKHRLVTAHTPSRLFDAPLSNSQSNYPRSRQRVNTATAYTAHWRIGICFSTA